MSGYWRFGLFGEDHESSPLISLLIPPLIPPLISSNTPSIAPTNTHSKCQGIGGLAYSGKIMNPVPFTPTVDKVRNAIEAATGQSAHAHIYTYIHTCIHAYMLTHIHACIHTCIHTPINTYTHTHTHTCIRTYLLTYVRTYHFIL